MNLTGLIRHPHAFFEALRRLPALPWRYAWVPLLAGLAGGLSGAVLSQAVLASQAQARPALPLGFLWGVNIFGSVFVSLLIWVILWGLGSLGTGPAGRSGEVYGASFLAPLLWSVVLAVLVLLFPPQVTVAPPNLSGLSDTALVRALQQYLSAVMVQYAASPVVKFSAVMNYAIYLVQFWLAFIGFRVMMAGSPDSAARAWRGVLYAGGVLVVLGLAALLVSSAVTGLGGGLA